MRPAPHLVAVLTIDGAVGLELAMPGQVFGSAHPAGRPDQALYDVRVCGPQEGTSATAAGREAFRVIAPHPLSEAIGAGTVVVPASATAGAQPDDVLETLRAAHAGGARIVSICTGAYVLAAAGLLDGRRVTTHWAHAADLARRHPDVEVDDAVLFTDDGDVLTSAGVTAGLDLCLHLVRKDHGAAVATAVARSLVMPPQRSGTQAQFTECPAAPDAGTLEPTLRWMQARLSEPLTLTEIAEHAALSTRTLSRRFRAQVGTTPLQWLIRLRLHRARELLESTGLGIEQVASAAGFGTATLMRQHFTRSLGATPRAYREAFRSTSE